MSEQNHNSQESSFVSHLIELRTRLIHALLGMLLIFLPLSIYANDIYSLLANPLLIHMPEGTNMVAIEVISPFLTPLKLSLMLAIFISVPWIFYQIWLFISPALYKHEQRIALPLISAGTFLFYSGMLFAYIVVMPLIFKFLTATAPEGVAVMTDISKYLDFVLTLFFAFGVAFQVPIATFLLVKTGISTPQSLAEKRPYIIVGAFIVGMFLTPPDVISQTLLALPMWLLFEIGLFMSKKFISQTSTQQAK